MGIDYLCLLKDVLLSNGFLFERDFTYEYGNVENKCFYYYIECRQDGKKIEKAYKDFISVDEYGNSSNWNNDIMGIIMNKCRQEFLSDKNYMEQIKSKYNGN
jgi:hypothetical protein